MNLQHSLENIQLNTSRYLNIRERAQIIARRFHSLDDAPGIDPWQPDALDEWAATGGAGDDDAALCAAQFVLGVWNNLQPWDCGKFDILQAHKVWDQDNYQAFLAWALNPVHL